MIDVWKTAICPPHTPGLGLQLLLPQNVFLLLAQDEQFFMGLQGWVSVPLGKEELG